MADLLGTTPERTSGTVPPEEMALRAGERRAAAVIRWLPAGQVGELYYPFWDWDEPPFFKCFLRVDATAEEIRFRLLRRDGLRGARRRPAAGGRGHLDRERRTV